MQDESEFDTKWREIYKERVRHSHDSPAPETRERLAILETNQNNIMEKLEEFQINNKEEHQDIVKSLAEFHTKTNLSMKEITDKLDKALEKKAGIWVEKVLLWFGAIAGAGILAYLGSLIIKVIEKV